MTGRRQELFDDTNWEQSTTMRGRRELFDDTNWEEVMNINTYAVYMGYLFMAIKGLGYLVLTWTTVVLLGGFVSMLHKKDFWCLTFITLVQTAGIFDVSLNEKLSCVGKSFDGMIMGAFVGVLGVNRGLTVANLVCSMLASALLFVQLVMLCTVLCPLAIVYMFGILMSGGISLLRLIEHDYSNSDEEASNLAPAMDTLYFLALLQGVLFCYRFILGGSGKRLAKVMATECDESKVQLVYNYLHETRTGCEKDPSFVKGRNLITHAVHLIGSNSPVDCISGVKLLYIAICISDREMQKMVGKARIKKRDILIGQRMLMKHLVLSAPSSRHILKKVLETLDSRGLHDTETRYQAAVIVEQLVVDINLAQFPRGIQHISSLIGTFGQYSIAEPYQRDCQSDVKEQTWELRARHLALSLDARTKLEDYKKLLLQGMCILRKLAADENNCRIISDTPDLVSKIMAPVTSDLLHHITHDQGAWSSIVEGSMEVMRQLICAPGEIGAKLRREISSYKEAISTLQKILGCNKCNEELQLSTIRILTRLYVHTESSRSTDFVVLKKESREDFVRMLVDIFTHKNKSISIRAYAGGALSVLCFHGGISDATIVIQTRSGDVVDSLTKVLVHDKNKICIEAAAQILENLCTHYTNDDEYLGKLKKAMTDAMPVVIGAILRCGDETHTGKDGFAKPETDIENQCVKGKGISSSSSSHLQNGERDEEEKAMLSSLLSLCGTVYDMLISELGQDLVPHFDASIFLNKLEEIVVKQSEPTVENLSVFKAIAKMVISMMKHSGSRFVKEDLESLIETLSSASKNMLDLEHSMVFLSAASISETTLKLDRCTLTSLVKKAQELHVMIPSTSVSG